MARRGRHHQPESHRGRGAALDEGERHNTNDDDAVSALKAGQIDGTVVDLPTGYFVTAAQVEGSKIVGQFPTDDTPERFGMVLEKGSGLTACVSTAVDGLRAEGTLEKLEQQFLAGAFLK